MIHIDCSWWQFLAGVFLIIVTSHAVILTNRFLDAVKDLSEKEMQLPQPNLEQGRE